MSLSWWQRGLFFQLITIIPQSKFMEKTGIIWTEKTWNPLSGCQKISAGCKYCYAETIANKFKTAYPNGFDLTLRPHKLSEPLKNKTPDMYFVNSMSDLFWDKVPNEYRHKVLDIIEQAHWHQFQLLTKRPEIMLQFSKERKLPDNLWAGTTIESDKTRHRINILQEVEASIRWVSAEPLIQPIHFTDSDLEGIHQIIVGGESGGHLWKGHIAEERALVRYSYSQKGVKGEWVPREDRMDWVREIRDICIGRNVSFFFKQWGGSYPEAAGRQLDGRTWNESPRYAGDKTHIDNDYLKHIESKIGNSYGTQKELF